MESANTDLAQHYYNSTRRRSFFYSRLFVILSMFILIIGLSLNLSLFYSNQKTNVASQASTGNLQSDLPSLPAGCIYQSQNNKAVVVCPTPSNTKVETNSQFAISFELPQLPSQCHYLTTNKGYKVSCLNSQSPIPNAVVTLPTSCSMPLRLNNQSIECKDTKGTVVLVSLPTVPEGCGYIKQQATLSIACSSSAK